MFVNEFSLYIARKVLDILKKVRPTGIELVSPAPQADDNFLLRQPFIVVKHLFKIRLLGPSVQKVSIFPKRPVFWLLYPYSKALFTCSIICTACLRSKPVF